MGEHASCWDGRPGTQGAPVRLEKGLGLRFLLGRVTDTCSESRGLAALGRLDGRLPPPLPQTLAASQPEGKARQALSGGWALRTPPPRCLQQPVQGRPKGGQGREARGWWAHCSLHQRLTPSSPATKGEPTVSYVGERPVVCIACPRVPLRGGSPTPIPPWENPSTLCSRWMPGRGIPKRGPNRGVLLAPRPGSPALACPAAKRSLRLR